MGREFNMNAKFTVTENFKSAEKDRKISFLNKLAKILNASAKYPSGKNERWKQA